MSARRLAGRGGGAGFAAAFALAFALAPVGCGGGAGRAPAAYAPLGEGDAIGRLYRYVRSNRDGSLPEAITVYRRDATHVEVLKTVSPCTNAAYVTAELDPLRHEALRLVAGRLARDGSQAAFGTLRLDPRTRALAAEMALPEGPLRFAGAAPHAPWHLYDFDLASLTVVTPNLRRPRQGFAFGLALLIGPLTASPSPLRDLGRVEARFAGEATRLGRPSLRFRLEGPGLPEGELWLDAREGHLVEVTSAAPNHDEYKDFRLALVSIDDGGAPAWKAARDAHWRGCAEAP